MVLKKGSKGKNVKLLQEFLKISADGDFGSGTEKAVKQWQKLNGLSIDGVVGRETMRKMGLSFAEEEVVEFDEKYKGVTIDGSAFPDDPIKDNVKVSLSKETKEEYFPALEEATTI